MGFSVDVAGLFIEMSKAFNEGLIDTPRTRENTTKPLFDDFAVMFAEIFFAILSPFIYSYHNNRASIVGL